MVCAPNAKHNQPWPGYDRTLCPRCFRLQPDAHKKKLESSSAREERLAAEAELAKALEEENEDDETMDGF